MGLNETQRAEVLERATRETGLPCVDPITSGVEALLGRL